MIYIISDNDGYNMKNKLIELLDYDFIDLGSSIKTYNYHNITNILCDKIIDNDIGILICGLGIGNNIIANRHNHIRSILSNDIVTAKLAREKYNANVLSISERIIGIDLACSIIKIFIETKYKS
jgi:ribose 5-phosphate isomerase B